VELVDRFRETFAVLIERHKKRVVVGLVLAVVAADVIWVLVPLLSALYGASVESRAISESVNAIRDDRAREDQIAKGLETAKARLAKTEERAAVGDISLYMEALSRIANETGVKIIAIKPTGHLRPETPEEDKSKTPPPYRTEYFEITAMSAYHALGRFLARIETNPVFIKVLKMKIEGNPDAPLEHEVKMNVLMVQKRAEAAA
jgi:hypothetical protein